MSLPRALRAIARREGHTIGLDDLNAALGLSWMATAVPDQDNPRAWPLYARDAFLVSAGRHFGITVRPIHPPAATRGVIGLPEFEQHFHASYRPLVEQALQHGQPVLAWRGWPGDRDLQWGVITGRCDSGMGLAGVTFERDDEVLEDEAIPLISPPVQLHVVEAMSPPRSDPEGLLEMVITHAGTVLANGLADRLGVLTGAAAYDFWLDRLRAGWPPDGRGIDGEPAGAVDVVVTAFKALFDAVVAMHESGHRFLRGYAGHASPRRQRAVDVLTELCQSTVRFLREAAGSLDGCFGTEASGRRNDVLAAVARAKDAAARADRAISV